MFSAPRKPSPSAPGPHATPATVPTPLFPGPSCSGSQPLTSWETLTRAQVLGTQDSAMSPASSPKNTGPWELTCPEPLAPRNPAPSPSRSPGPSYQPPSPPGPCFPIFSGPHPSELRCPNPQPTPSGLLAPVPQFPGPERASGRAGRRGNRLCRHCRPPSHSRFLFTSRLALGMGAWWHSPSAARARSSGAPGLRREGTHGAFLAYYPSPALLRFPHPLRAGTHLSLPLLPSPGVRPQAYSQDPGISCSPSPNAPRPDWGSS